MKELTLDLKIEILETILHDLKNCKDYHIFKHAGLCRMLRVQFNLKYIICQNFRDAIPEFIAPDNVLNTEGFWWERDDKESRVKYLENLISKLKQKKD